MNNANINYWTDLSIQYAEQRSYLDDLFSVYPTIPNGIRDIDKTSWNKIEQSFNNKDNIALIQNLLKLDLFPIKDSYIAYLKRDKTSIKRNPNTVDRICGMLYEMGLDKIFIQATLPKETNRQIGPLFKRWLHKGSLGTFPIKIEDFLKNDCNAILDGTDAQMMDFAKNCLNYTNNKGLDFIARFNKKYVIGEAKFLTDFGGHQNAQFNDAITTAKSQTTATTIAILDGVSYIKVKTKCIKL